MPDEVNGVPAANKMTESRPVQPVVATVIGTGDGSRLPSGTVAETPGAAQPNVVVTVIPPLLALAIRFANAYITTLLGLITAGLVGKDVIPAADFLALVVICAKLSIAGPCVDALKNIVTLLGRLEGKYPLLTGNV
jgi:hypothetical protein